MKIRIPENEGDVLFFRPARKRRQLRRRLSHREVDDTDFDDSDEDEPMRDGLGPHFRERQATCPYR
jgi:hypothetical protein